MPNRHEIRIKFYHSQVCTLHNQCTQDVNLQSFDQTHNAWVGIFSTKAFLFKEPILGSQLYSNEIFHDSMLGLFNVVALNIS